MRWTNYDRGYKAMAEDKRDFSEAEILALYRSASEEQPPPELDARILAMAAEAASPSPATPDSNSARRVFRWAAPFASAAVLVLTVSLYDWNSAPEPMFEPAAVPLRDFDDAAASSIPGDEETAADSSSQSPAAEQVASAKQDVTAARKSMLQENQSGSLQSKPQPAAPAPAAALMQKRQAPEPAQAGAGRSDTVLAEDLFLPQVLTEENAERENAPPQESLGLSDHAPPAMAVAEAEKSAMDLASDGGVVMELKEEDTRLLRMATVPESRARHESAAGAAFSAAATRAAPSPSAPGIMAAQEWRQWRERPLQFWIYENADSQHYWVREGEAGEIRRLPKAWLRVDTGVELQRGSALPAVGVHWQEPQ